MAVTLCAVLVGVRLLLGTRAGLVLQAIGSDADRARTLGYEIRHYQTFFFAVSGVVSGPAGLVSLPVVLWGCMGAR